MIPRAEMAEAFWLAFAATEGVLVALVGAFVLFLCVASVAGFLTGLTGRGRR